MASHVSAQQRVEREYPPATPVVGRENYKNIFYRHHKG